MRRWLLTVLSLLLVGAGALAEDKKAMPREELQALVKEYQTAQQEYLKAVSAAKTDPEKRKIVLETFPRLEAYSSRFLDLARANARDPVAAEALVWVATHFGFNKEGDKALEMLLKDYSDSDKLDQVCRTLVYSQSHLAEPFLRTILEKNPHPEVQGQACFSLARYLKAHIPQAEPKQAEKLTRECEGLFQRVVDRYGSIKYQRDTLGQAASREFFEMRRLVVGKEAPEIEGEDQDGKKFKLSDYRGKVVVLVFWGDWSSRCQAAYPQLRMLVKQFDGKPLALLGVDSDETRARLQEVMKKEALPWRSWWDGGIPEGPITGRWNIHEWPTLYVLDVKGVIRYKNLDLKELDAAVEALLKS